MSLQALLLPNDFRLYGNFVGVLTKILAGTGITVANPTGPQPTVGITSTAVTPGSYTNASLTVNQQGQITAASSGTKDGFSLACFAVNNSNVTSGSQLNLTPWVINSGSFAPPGLKTSTNFNSTTGIYTVPTTGWYCMSGSLTVVAGSTTPAYGSCTFSVNINGGGTYILEFISGSLEQGAMSGSGATVSQTSISFSQNFYWTAATTVGGLNFTNNFDQTITVQSPAAIGPLVLFSIVQI